MEVADLLAPVVDEMSLVEARLRSLAEARPGDEGMPPSWMLTLLDHVIGEGGKRIRPAMTLLAGSSFQYQRHLLVPMATAVELLHTATLVHDDTVDHSPLRRGRPTVNALWNDNIAVLAGDYLFANSADLVATTGNVRVMQLFARTLMSICRGELGQVFSAYDPGVGRAQYFERISNKTAALFAMATESGAVLSGAPEAAVQGLRHYGDRLGTAFQIVDDILDFAGDEAELGKPVGSDLIEGTMTLPAILLAERYPKDNPIPSFFADGSRRGELGRVIEMIRDSDIIADSYQVAAEFAAAAREGLDGLPAGPVRRSLVAFTYYVLERRK